MPAIQANGIRLEYDDRGDNHGSPMLLVMGYAQHMLAWPDGFCDLLAGHGFRVIRFDNRDSGLSEKFEDFGVPDLSSMIAKALQGQRSPAPYTLDDMADDAAGLLEALGIGAAHIVGVSMGGAIAQLVAARHPGRTMSLTSMMATSGRKGLSWPSMEANQALLSRPKSMDKADVAEHAVQLFKVIGSPGYPMDDERVRGIAELLYERAFYPQGAPRQYAAILASGDRVASLPRVSAPTLVIHGAADPLIPPDHGEDVARLIPGARLELIDGMGHNLPPQLWERLAALIADHCRAAA